VEGVYDVGAVFGDELGEIGEGAGLIEEMDAEADETAILHEAALDDARKQGDVDVAAADQDGGAGVRGEGGAFLQKAARAVAPAPSARVFSRSRRVRMEDAISSSSTVTISSTYFCTTGNVTSPARRTAMPSAMVVAGSRVTG
jgi:hypothetical protein